jgi:hypothetical protein
MGEEKCPDFTRLKCSHSEKDYAVAHKRESFKRERVEEDLENRHGGLKIEPADNTRQCRSVCFISARVIIIEIEKLWNCRLIQNLDIPSNAREYRHRPGGLDFQRIGGEECGKSKDRKPCIDQRISGISEIFQKAKKNDLRTRLWPRDGGHLLLQELVLRRTLGSCSENHQVLASQMAVAGQPAPENGSGLELSL